MQYCYVTANTDGYSVVEKRSELILFQTKSKRSANITSKQISGGAGFKGHTPPFFAIGKKELPERG